MKRGGMILASILLLAACAAPSHAAPNADVAFERYLIALAESRLDSDHQGFVFETLDGQTLLSHNVDCPFNPASVVKLATSSVALDRLGQSYRFPTAFYASGTINPETGVLNGDLVVLGSGDPSLVTEHLFGVARELRARHITRIAGNVVVKGPFYCNFSMSRDDAGETLRQSLDVEKWSKATDAAFARYRSLTGVSNYESVPIDGAVVTSESSDTRGLTPLFTLRSVPLIQVLKQLNNYSNNWMAHIVGSRVGGADAVRETVGSRLQIPGEEFYLQSTSGLGRNGMRPRDVILMLRDLQNRLTRDKLAPSALMPVAGVDPGTLEDRFLQPPYRGAVVAKTGTLRGVSVLAGYMYTRSKGVVLFVIMNEGGTPTRFRYLQDNLVSEMFEACGGPMPTSYSRLSGTPASRFPVIDRASGSIPAATQARAAAAN